MAALELDSTNKKRSVDEAEISDSSEQPHSSNPKKTRRDEMMGEESVGKDAKIVESNGITPEDSNIIAPQPKAEKVKETIESIPENLSTPTTTTAPITPPIIQEELKVDLATKQEDMEPKQEIDALQHEEAVYIQAVPKDLDSDMVEAQPPSLPVTTSSNGTGSLIPTPTSAKPVDPNPTVVKPEDPISAVVNSEDPVPTVAKPENPVPTTVKPDLVPTAANPESLTSTNQTSSDPPPNQTSSKVPTEAEPTVNPNLHPITTSLPTSTDQPTTSVASSPANSSELVSLQLKHCMTVLKSLKRHKKSPPFLRPVDPVALNLPTYFDIVKRPMDLTSMEGKLVRGEYASWEEFVADGHLMCQNAIAFNGPSAPVAQFAISIKASLDKQMERVPMELSKSGAAGRRRTSDMLGVKVDRPKRDVHAPARDLMSASPTRSGKKNAQDVKFGASVYRELMSKKYDLFSWPFKVPVDPIALNIPEYTKICPNPMDLSTVKLKLDRDEYMNAQEIADDIRQMLQNCFNFNKAGDAIYAMGKQMEGIFEEKWAGRPDSYRKKRRVSGSSESESEDEINNQQIALLQQNLSMINSQLQMLMEKKSRRKRKRSETSIKHRSKKPSSNSTKPKKPRKKRSVKYENIKHMEESLIPDLDLSQKQFISDAIGTLEPEDLGTAVQLIRDAMPNLGDDQEEIELDIESMDKRTLYQLWRFIDKCQGGKKAIAAVASSSSGSSSSGSESESGSD